MTVRRERQGMSLVHFVQDFLAIFVESSWSVCIPKDEVNWREFRWIGREAMRENFVAIT